MTGELLWVDVGDLDLDVRASGPEDGRPVLLLHGFPQTSQSWARVTPLLAGAGLRCYTPDQLGYSPGGRAHHRRGLRGLRHRPLPVRGAGRLHWVPEESPEQLAAACSTGSRRRERRPRLRGTRRHRDRHDDDIPGGAVRWTA